MRRPLTLAALALMLFGVEVVTGAVPLAAVRLWTGFGARVGGEESVISGLCAPPLFDRHQARAAPEATQDPVPDPRNERHATALRALWLERPCGLMHQE